MSDSEPRLLHHGDVRSGRHDEGGRGEGVRDLHVESAQHLRSPLSTRVLLCGMR